jgi:hypothetical protein
MACACTRFDFSSRPKDLYSIEAERARVPDGRLHRWPWDWAEAREAKSGGFLAVSMSLTAQPGGDLGAGGYDTTPGWVETDWARKARPYWAGRNFSRVASSWKNRNLRRPSWP